jgi:GntR family transcriptional regulator
MSRRLVLDPGLATPLWGQIEEQVRLLVASGVLRPGAAMPSVRDLARELTVNPATVAKAYRQLVDDGLLAVRRGAGTFVAERPPLMPAPARARELAHAAERYAGAVRLLGATLEEAEAALREAWPSSETSDSSQGAFDSSQGSLDSSQGSPSARGGKGGG